MNEVRPALGSVLDGASNLGITDLREIGRGASSTVYSARQERYGRNVAIKVFATPLVDDRSRRRFERECKILGRLSAHPYVVNLFGSGFDEAERPFIIMDLCERGSLQHQLISQGPMSVEDVLRTGIKVCSALEFAHRSDVLHRDIKPANVLRNAFNEPLLSDFGISAEADAELSWTTGESLTPLYAAPEVLEDGGGHVGADIWSLGSTLYALLLGKAPFSDTTSSLVALVNRITRDPAPPLERDDVPAPLLKLLNETMSKDAAARPTSAAALARRLQAVQSELGVAITELVELDPTIKPVTELPDARDGAGSMDALPATAGRATVVPGGQLTSDASTAATTSATADVLRKDAMPAEAIDLAQTVVRAPVPAIAPQASLDLLPELTAHSGLLSSRRIRWLLACAGLIAVAVSVIAVGTTGGKSAPPPSVPSPLPVAAVTTISCTGYDCHITVDRANVPRGAALKIAFGDGQVRMETATTFSHSYGKVGHFTLSAAWIDGTRSGVPTTTRIVLQSFARTVRVTAPRPSSRRLQVTIGASASCRTSTYQVQRFANGRWRDVGSTHNVGRAGRAHVTVPSSGRYRMSVAARDVTGGRCASALATRTVSAPTTGYVASASTPSTSSGGSTPTGRSTSSRSTQPVVRPTVGPPPRP